MSAHSGPSASNDFRYNALLLNGNGVNGLARYTSNFAPPSYPLKLR